MSNPSKKAKTSSTSGGPFAKRPREMLVWILEFFTMYEVAGLQRLVCREFRDAGQERIHERGGRKLYEEGMVYYYGLDYKTINKPRARLLLRASRDAGCKTALARTNMSASNLSNEDKQKIFKDLHKIATSSPYHWVYYFIGQWYRKGWGGEEKKDQAVVWLERAARKGNTRAMFDLAVCYHKGRLGLTKSRTKANELFALAADKGYAEARFNLGNSYRKGRGDLAIDFNRCVELWDQSAKQGYVKAQANLGDMYRSGSRDGPPMTIPVDPQLCFRWTLAAAKQEDVNSMGRIGYVYHTGTGVEQSDESAFKWYKKAAKKGKKHSQYSLGYHFEHGRGCEMDLVQAMHWYQKSAAQEYQKAIDAVERLA
jgi:TPR repeat protein